MARFCVFRGATPSLEAMFTKAVDNFVDNCGVAPRQRATARPLSQLPSSWAQNFSANPWLERIYLQRIDYREAAVLTIIVNSWHLWTIKPFAKSAAVIHMVRVRS
jgi:hypothetical protein